MISQERRGTCMICTQEDKMPGIHDPNDDRYGYCWKCWRKEKSFKEDYEVDGFPKFYKSKTKMMGRRNKILATALFIVLICGVFSTTGIRVQAQEMKLIAPLQNSDQVEQAGKEQGNQTATVLRIIDGDTIITDKGKIRLALVNAPEKGQPGFSKSRNFTSNICEPNENITFDVDNKQHPSYNRTLATVYCPEGKDRKLINLNLALLMNKDAIILPQFCKLSEFRLSSWVAPSCALQDRQLANLTNFDTRVLEQLVYLYYLLEIFKNDLSKNQEISNLFNMVYASLTNPATNQQQVDQLIQNVQNAYNANQLRISQHENMRNKINQTMIKTPIAVGETMTMTTANNTTANNTTNMTTIMKMPPKQNKTTITIENVSKGQNLTEPLQAPTSIITDADEYKGVMILPPINQTLSDDMDDTEKLQLQVKNADNEKNNDDDDDNETKDKSSKATDKETETGTGTGTEKDSSGDLKDLPTAIVADQPTATDTEEDTQKYNQTSKEDSTNEKSTNEEKIRDILKNSLGSDHKDDPTTKGGKDNSNNNKDDSGGNEDSEDNSASTKQKIVVRRAEV